MVLDDAADDKLTCRLLALFCTRKWVCAASCSRPAAQLHLPRSWPSKAADSTCTLNVMSKAGSWAHGRQRELVILTYNTC